MNDFVTLLSFKVVWNNFVSTEIGSNAGILQDLDTNRNKLITVIVTISVLNAKIFNFKKSFKIIGSLLPAILQF